MNIMKTGAQLRNEGMALAADSKCQSWRDRALEYVKLFAELGQPFMVEDVRTYAGERLSNAPNSRAWGSVITRAKRAGLVKQVGYAPVKNPAAHKANVSVWQGV